ncbi:MAG: phenylacetate-CoA oxygenase subunit PaaC [Actinomycetota bacterium]|nr:phenylacetate-CoA oxygenase subunit PaaC [Actinomycetota bacterium]
MTPPPPLELADDCLVLGQRLGEWASRAPTLEEDVAILNISLDLLGVARTLYGGIGDEDELAFLRLEPDFRNCLLVELPNGDFGQTMARQLLFSAWQVLVWESLLDSNDVLLAGVAGRAVKEARYHLDHASAWVARLGDGTAESHARVQAGLDAAWPYVFELFETMPELEASWRATVLPVLTTATLSEPETTWRPSGGRRGQHTEHLGYLLAEMQSLHRAHPGATW